MSTTNSPIENALNRLTMRIPRQILEMAFFPAEDHQTKDATNLNERIRRVLIDTIVMSDINNQGGVAVELDIPQSWMQMLSPTMCVVNVPKTVTQNRSINSAINSSFGTNLVSNAAVGIANQGSQYLMGAHRVMNSVKSVPYVGTAEVRVIGSNQIEIRNFVSIPVRLRGIIRVAYSHDFTELRRPYWKDFAELVELAVKSYCYNNLLPLMDRAFLQGGVEMGRISSKIEEWSNEAETYDDYLRERWNRILILNDPILSQRLVKKITNP